MAYDLSGAWVMAGYYIANVSPSLRTEAFRFPSGALVETKLQGNPVKLESPSGEVVMIYKRGTSEWEQLLGIRANINAKLEAYKVQRQREMDRELKTELDQFVINQLADQGILVEGEEHKVEITEERAAAQAAADAKYFAADDDDEEEEPEPEEPAKPVYKCELCPDREPFKNKAGLNGHMIMHRVKGDKKKEPAAV